MDFTSATRCSSLITIPIIDDDVVRMCPSDLIGWDNRGTKGVRLVQLVLGEPVSYLQAVWKESIERSYGNYTQWDLFSYLCMHWLQFRKHNGFRFPPSFLWKGLISFFLHDAFHFSVRQRSQKLILHQILDAYPWISFINNRNRVSSNRPPAD